MSAHNSMRHVGKLTVAGVAAASLSLSGCGFKDSTSLSSRLKNVRSTATDVKFKDCGAQCAGEIDGAKYTIKMPQRWNGTLLLYSHGYRFAQPAPPNFDAVETNAQVSSKDNDGTGSDPLSTQLLAAGYALAGSSYKTNGWAVEDGVKAGKDLHDTFVKLVGKPKRTYVWGDSLGGLITEILAEQNPNWVDGAAPMCGAVAGPNYNFDVALDVAVAIKALIDPTFKVTGYASADEAAANWKHASAAVQKAAADIAGGGTAKVLFIAALVDAPTETATYDGHDITSQVKARVEMLLTALAFGTSGRYELEQRVKGNLSDNSAADYAKRIDESEAGLIKTVGGNVDKLEQTLAAAPKITADSTARNAAEKLGDTTGKIVVPTIAMHTEADPLVLVQNESVLAQRARSAHSAGNLVQVFIAPPKTYSETDKAPYGAGHCNFSDTQRIGLLTALDGWVRSSTYPGQAGIGPLLGEGYNSVYVPGPWPGNETN
jgi:pimeloyl-ACP methyl ester carboxylesterase